MNLLINKTPEVIMELTSIALYMKYYGFLMTPRRWSAPVDNSVWAADNDSFSSWNEKLFMSMLRGLSKYKGCKFISCPDVVGDAWSTYDRFKEWQPVIKSYGLPVAYVLQDGQKHVPIPYDSCDAVFIGGSTEFKLSESTARMALEAKDLGKWVHMGRVNGNRRILYAQAIECDSVDGSSYSKWRTEKVPATIPYLAYETKPLWRGILCG